MPPESELPSVLRSLLDRHTFTLDLDQWFDVPLNSGARFLQAARAVCSKTRWLSRWAAFSCSHWSSLGASVDFEDCGWLTNF